MRLGAGDAYRPKNCAFDELSARGPEQVIQAKAEKDRRSLAALIAISPCGVTTPGQVMRSALFVSARSMSRIASPPMSISTRRRNNLGSCFRQGPLPSKSITIVTSSGPKKVSRAAAHSLTNASILLALLFTPARPATPRPLVDLRCRNLP